jgi:hypothetical protein
MNNLSTLLYVADVVDSLKVIVMLFAVGLFGLCCGLFLYGAATRDNAYSDGVKWKHGLRAQVIGLWLLLLPAVFLSAWVFIPYRQTVMLIAASETGEDILSTDAARQIGGEAGEVALDSLRLLHQYIKQQLPSEGE